MKPSNQPTKGKKTSVNQLKQQVNQLEEKWKRALADYQNLEKRIKKQQQEFVSFANAALIDKLLGVLDDLERAAYHHHDKGLKMIVSKLTDVLKSEGVEEIKAQGETFNPDTMDAADIVKGTKNKVIKVITKGYTLNSKVLRPAKVEVGSGASPAEPDPAAGSKK